METKDRGFSNSGKIFDFKDSPAAAGERVLGVTRPGFDLLHQRAVLGYSFDCSTGGTPGRVAVLCTQTGEVLLEKVDGSWKVSHYTALLF